MTIFLLVLKQLAVGTSPVTLPCVRSNRTQWRSTASHAQTLYRIYSFGAPSIFPSFHRFVAQGSYHVSHSKQLAVGTYPAIYLHLHALGDRHIFFYLSRDFLGFTVLIKHAA